MNYQLHNKSLPFYFPATLKNKKNSLLKKKNTISNTLIEKKKVVWGRSSFLKKFYSSIFRVYMAILETQCLKLDSTAEDENILEWSMATNPSQPEEHFQPRRNGSLMNRHVREVFENSFSFIFYWPSFLL